MSHIKIPTNFVAEYADEIQVLHTIQRQFPDAIIAGGFVRDILADSLYKDVDIFLQYNISNDPLQVFSQMFNLDPSTVTDIFNFSDSIELVKPPYNYYMTRKDDLEFTPSYVPIQSIVNIMKNYVPYQVILLNIPPLEYIEKYFNLNISKAYFDGTKIKALMPCVNDFTNKTLTVTGNITSYDHFAHLQKYVQRIHHKFSNFQIIYDSNLQQRWVKAANV